MAEKMISEGQYRSETTTHRFRAALFTTIAGGASFGFFTSIPSLIGLIGEFSKAVTSASFIPLALQCVTMVAVAALAVVSTYYAQSEFSELRVLEDEHLARKNAEYQMQRQNTRDRDPDVGFKFPESDQPDKKRADGKTWAQHITEKDMAAAQQASHTVH